LLSDKLLVFIFLYLFCYGSHVHLALARISSHVIQAFLPMSSLRWHVGRLGSMGRKPVGIYGCGISSFLFLDEK
jgi:hypothetical protein